MTTSALTNNTIEQKNKRVPRVYSDLFILLLILIILAPHHPTLISTIRPATPSSPPQQKSQHEKSQPLHNPHVAPSASGGPQRHPARLLLRGKPPHGPIQKMAIGSASSDAALHCAAAYRVLYLQPADARLPVSASVSVAVSQRPRQAAADGGLWGRLRMRCGGGMGISRRRAPQYHTTWCHTRPPISFPRQSPAIANRRRIFVVPFPSPTRAGTISTEARTLRNGRRPQTRGLERGHSRPSRCLIRPW